MKRILLIILILLSTYFLYTTKSSKKVEQYAYIVGETEASQMPSKTSNYVFDFGECTNDATVSFNKESWSPIINNITTARTKCTIHFKQMYKDGSGAEPPEIYEGMIPIKFTGSTMTVADTKVDAWYNYNNHEWANAALIDYSNETIRDKYFDGSGNIKSGTTIDINDLLQMYVWIPRYKYQLWNAEFGVSEPQAINITFESTDAPKSSGSTNGNWLTHPAFTFGDTELNGIWVGKFETNGTKTKPTILPNKTSLSNINISEMFYSLYNMSGNIYGINKSYTDTRMMKNIEWGAVAYLSHSIYGRYNADNTCIASGCEIWINNINTGYGESTPLNDNQPQYGPSISGCAGDSANAEQIANVSTCPSGKTWDGGGINASTTGNIQGIYDMAGGTWEYVMGVMYDSTGTKPLYKESGFDESNMPENKYYDTYSYQLNDSIRDVDYWNEPMRRYHLGEATREILQRLNYTYKDTWNSGVSGILHDALPWIPRGGGGYHSISSNIFAFEHNTGCGLDRISFRAVLSKV